MTAMEIEASLPEELAQTTITKLYHEVQSLTGSVRLSEIGGYQDGEAFGRVYNFRCWIFITISKKGICCDAWAVIFKYFQVFFFFF